jgi:hypothetical protein
MQGGRHDRDHGLNRRSVHQRSPVLEERAAEIPRLRRTGGRVAAAERHQPEIRCVGAEMVHVARAVLAGSDDADADRRPQACRHGGAQYRSTGREKRPEGSARTEVANAKRGS